MIRLFTQLISIAVATIWLSPQAFGAIYTASNSGNFSSPSTWTGGIVPPTTMAADDIYVNSGVTLTLDRNLVVNGVASLLQLQGTGKIVGTGSYYLVFNSGQVTADALSSIDVDSIVIGGSILSNFDGNITANSVTLAAPNLPGIISINAKEILNMSTGNTMLSSGTSINLGGGSVTPLIIMSGGDLTLIPGVNFSLTNPYNVRYTNPSTIIGNGFELSGSGLADIEIAVPGGQAINVGAPLTINGALKLTSGALALNTNTLTLGGNCAIDAAGTGTIQGDNNATIAITTSATTVGTIRFATNGALLKNLIMDAAGAEVKIANSLTIDSSLRLLNGNINIQGNTLTVGQMQGVVVGGSANSYVVTEIGGILRLPIKNTESMTYHVGHSGGYAPAIITNKNGGIYPEFGINVSNEVKAQGTTGPDISSVEPLVKTMWTTSHTGSQTANYDIEVMWSTGAEVNGFNRVASNIAFYTTGKWTRSTTSAAGSSGSMYTQKKEGANGFGAHTVFDLQTLGVKDIATGNTITIYPNPATTVLNFDLKSFENLQATIYNTTGQVVSNTLLNVNNSSINIAQLPHGVYYVQLHGNDFNGTAKFVKQ